MRHHDLLSALRAADGDLRYLAADLAPVRQRRYAIAGGPPGYLDALLLAALGLAGWAYRADLVASVNAIVGLAPDSGTLKRAYSRLETAGLWQTHPWRIAWRPAAFVALTELGRERLAAAAIPPVEGEWISAGRGHGPQSNAHSAAICLFAHHARRFGFDVEICPTGPEFGRLEPDCEIVDAAEVGLAVEVQGRGGERYRHAQKWRNQAAYQGRLALCALTPAAAVRLAHEAQFYGQAPGVATDLSTLATRDEGGLWTLAWSRWGPIEERGW
jgi:hypothetical protein